MVTVHDLKALNDKITSTFTHAFTDMQHTLTAQHHQNKDQIAALEDAFSNLPDFPLSKGPAGFQRAPIFRGEGDNAQAFLDQFNLYADLFQWSEEQRLQGLPLSLTGTAQVWYFTLDKTKFTTYSQLIDLFKQQFLSHSDNWMLRQELSQRRQQKGESLAQYIAFIRQRCLRLAIPDKEAMHYFIQGLEPTLRSYVILQQPQSLDAAEQAAKIRNSVSSPELSSLSVNDIMALQKSFVQELRNDGLLHDPHQQPKPIDKRQRHNQPRHNGFGPVPERPAYDPSSEIRRIIREELRAHKAPTFHFNTRGNFGRATRTTNGDIICSYCNKVGHGYRVCRARLNDNQPIRENRRCRQNYQPTRQPFYPRNQPTNQTNFHARDSGPSNYLHSHPQRQYYHETQTPHTRNQQNTTPHPQPQHLN